MSAGPVSRSGGIFMFHDVAAEQQILAVIFFAPRIGEGFLLMVATILMSTHRLAAGRRGRDALLMARRSLFLACRRTSIFGDFRRAAACRIGFLELADAPRPARR